MSFRIKPMISIVFLQSLFALALFLVYQPYYIQDSYPSLIQGAWFLIILSFAWLLPRWSRLIYSSIVTILLSVGLWMQTVYARAFLQYARVNLLFTLNKEARQSWTSIQEFIKPEDVRYILIPLLFIATSIIITMFTRSTKTSQWPRLIVFTLFIIMGTSLLIQFNQCLTEDRERIDPFLYYKTDHFIYSSIPSTSSFVDRFGVLGLLQKDLTEIFITPLITNANDENQKITTLFQNQTTSEPNEQTGLLQGKSVLMIEAESLMHLAIHPILTPTLYRLRAEGFNFTGYNSALLPGSTSDTEFMANTSLIPANDGYGTFMKYALNEYPLTLAKTFTQEGYYSLAAHNNYGEFYNRNRVLPALGYDFFDAYRMGFEGQMIPDSIFIEPIKWISYERERFFSFWITFNGHQPYSISEMSEEFIPYYEQAKVLYPTLPEAELVYLAKTMDFDRALSSLIIDFTNSGRIDDLVIIIFGDHFAKGAFDAQTNIDLVCDIDSIPCRSTPFIIWHTAIQGEIITTPSNALDILPTTFDLMGFEYNRALTLGSSLFDHDYEGFYFDAWGKIVVGDLVYDQNTQTLNDIPILDSESLDPKIIQAIELIQLAPAIVENNYFASSFCQESFTFCQ